MRPLCYYRKIEDARRRDAGEGEGRVVYGTGRFWTTSPNPHYILCFSGPHVDVGYLATKYYPYVIRLSQPNEFVRDAAAYLEKDADLADEMWLKCVQVRYDRDQPVESIPEPASEERTSMSYGQKAPRDSADCEYRLVLTLPMTSSWLPPEIGVELHKRLEYAEMVELPGDNEHPL